MSWALKMQSSSTKIYQGWWGEAISLIARHAAPVAAGRLWIIVPAFAGMTILFG